MKKDAKGKKKRVVVAVSGGFDPIHIGHVRYLTEAKKLGTELVVILNNDNWLKKKKGFVFMPESERIEVLMGIKAVDRVVVTGHKTNDPDRSVSKVLAKVKPDIFANGGDRKSEVDIPETTVCKKYGIKMLFGVGSGGKVQSSSWLTNNIAANGILDVRPWGYMHTYKKDKHFWIKTINVSPGRRLSLQKHAHRDEFWVCIEGTVIAEIGKRKKVLKPGDFVTFKKGVRHRLSSANGGAIVEVAHGTNVHEEDIIRFADDFGRK
ncbi:adenylyltransferase/cytidyltransferase family protein [Patescibacteria group bacterium]|nr:adenylyltransferase/cytidyltransferase family protein [Patescibacteria group bacterium]